MITDRIKYGRSFQVGLSIWERIDMEATIEQGDDLEKCFSELKNQVETTHKKLNPHLYPKGNEAIIESFGEIPERQQVIQIESKETAAQKVIAQINECSELKVLESFSLIVKKNPELKPAYDKKLKQLKHEST
jgi:hypothetical protein